MYTRITNSLLDAAIALMEKAPPTEKSVGMLGVKKADGTQCFCALGFICVAAMAENSVKLHWVSIEESFSKGAICAFQRKEFLQAGVTHCAEFNGSMYGLPAEVAYRIGGDEDALFVGRSQDKLVRLNDDSETTPQELAALLKKEGLYAIEPEEA